MSDDQNNSVSQYLTFEQNEDVYGINIRCIKEVLEIRDITKLPRSMEFMRGVINLRGQVVPVIDLKLKFGLEKTNFTVDTCIIILEVAQQDGGSSLFGALADSVREVIDLDDTTVTAPPKVGASVDSAFIYGIGKVDEEFIVILDALKLCSHDDIKLISEVADQSATELVAEL